MIKKTNHTAILAAVCMIAIIACVLMMNLRSIHTDEGMRLGIINGNQGYSLNEPTIQATWADVIKANTSSAYQPLYFLLQNTLMRVAQTHDIAFVRFTNIFFLWVCLQGLISLSRNWPLVPRVFGLVLFSFNAYLISHVLHIREYPMALAFYVWSTWLVLKLDQRPLDRTRTDLALFAFYGVLMVAGFYTQSWVVFPCIGQGLYLWVRNRRRWRRFYAHLLVSYAIVCFATIPYLLANPQKVDNGRWGSLGTELWPQLSTGFHLVLSGNLPQPYPFSTPLLWSWITVIGLGLWLLFRRNQKVNEAVESDRSRTIRQHGALMVACILVSLSFQLHYFFRVDNLSLWPRYFVVHYFFLNWLVVLAVLRIHHETTHATGHTLWRRGWQTVMGAIGAIVLSSAVYQVISYYRNPYLDTGMSAQSNWNTWAREQSLHIRPGDIVLSHDYISRATLTFTQPLTNPVILPHELPEFDSSQAERVVYLESSYAKHEHEQLVAYAAAAGFTRLETFPVHTTDGTQTIDLWVVLVFSRES